MPNSNKVSIQLKLGGHSFSAKMPDLPDGGMVEVVVDTHKVTLAPREAVSLDTASEILCLVGKGCAHNEQSVCSELQAPIVAIMAISGECLANLVERYAPNVEFVSPLLDMRHNTECCLTLDVSDKVCYMRLFDGGLRRAEAYEMTTTEDALCYVVEWLQGEDVPIYIKGRADVAKLLGKYYKHVICE